MTATDEQAGDAITVVIVDDHGLVRQGVRAFLESQADMLVVGEADSGEAAVRLCAETAPDVALVDLVMPGLDGVGATRQIKQVSPRTHVIVLTSYHEDQHIVPAIRAGALSYLLKDIRPAELVEAVRKALRGEGVLHARVAAQLVEALQGDRTSEASRLAALSVRELEVLRLIAEGLSNAVLAERLFISEKTVKSHVSNILSKLHLADRTQATAFAWRKGLIKP